MKISIVALILLLGVLQYRLWWGDGNVNELRGYQRNIEALKREIADMRERNLALQAEIEDLSKGKEAIEERAREELGMIKEGEIFFQVIEEEK